MRRPRRQNHQSALPVFSQSRGSEIELERFECENIFLSHGAQHLLHLKGWFFFVGNDAGGNSGRAGDLR
jgi:hypothetical protein